mgnify:CR=1 FL=1
MKRSICRFAMVLMAATALSVSQTRLSRAEETCPAGGQCEAKCCEKECSAQKQGECEGCPITAAMKNLPQLSYAVGDEKTCCPQAASELAEKAGKPVHFVVAKKTYSKEAEAKLALVEETERFVSAFGEPKTCSISGTTTVAGKKLSCSVQATQTAALVKDAMQKVKLAYVVGEKQCHCPVEAKRVAEETGAPIVFVVGKETTPCNITARLNFARAKYRAAVEALVKSETKAEPVTSET